MESAGAKKVESAASRLVPLTVAEFAVFISLVIPWITAEI